MFRIDDGKRIRQFVARRVVIGHNHVESDLFAERNFGKRTHATVHRHHHADALLFQLRERFFVQTITFINAMRNVRFDIRAQRFECLHEQRRRRYAVHIEIAIDRDGFMRAHRTPQTLDRFVHAAHRERIAGKRIGSQKHVYLFRGRDISIVQNLDEQWIKLRKACEREG